MVATGLGASVAAPASFAAEFDCSVAKKFDSERSYSDADLSRSQFSVMVTDDGSAAVLSRCSFSPSAGKVTCDNYKADYIAYDRNAKIKKDYAFYSQFDLQNLRGPFVYRK